MAASSQIRVLIVDDHPQVRAGIAAVLGNESDILIVGQAGDGREALEKIAELSPDIVVMDIRMPLLDGLEATRLIMKSKSHPKVLILTQMEQEEYIKRAREYGAHGFFPKVSIGSGLAAAIRQVQKGQRLFAA